MSKRTTSRDMAGAEALREKGLLWGVRGWRDLRIAKAIEYTGEC